MTAKEEKKTLSRLPSARAVALSLISLFLLLLLLKNAEIAIQSMTYGVRLCTRTLIPSLFPFMVASELLVLGGAGKMVGAFLAKPCRALLGIGGEGACAVLLGMLCGFPVGTRCALSLHVQGRISDAELDRILSLSNHPSSSFLLYTVGHSMLHSKALGLRLYIVTLTSSLLLHILRQRISPLKDTSHEPLVAPLRERPSPVLAFTNAVSSSALALLQVCAFVVFFSAFVGCLDQMVLRLSLPRGLSLVLFGFFELTGGLSRAAESVGPAALYSAAWMIGWAGLSVHCQLIHLCAPQKSSFLRYLIFKLLQGLLNLPLLYLSFYLVP